MAIQSFNGYSSNMGIVAIKSHMNNKTHKKHESEQP